jgi:hypothetical protein
MNRLRAPGLRRPPVSHVVRRRGRGSAVTGPVGVEEPPVTSATLPASFLALLSAIGFVLSWFFVLSASRSLSGLSFPSHPLPYVLRQASVKVANSIRIAQACWANQRAIFLAVSP